MKPRSAFFATAAVVAAFLIGTGVASAQTPTDGRYVGTNGLNVPSFVWAGKTFANSGTTVSNRILGGIDAVPGDVYTGPSIYNRAPVVHVDYSNKSPQLGAFIHDEITQDAQNQNKWNGVMYFTGGGQPIALTTFTLVKQP
ncbi:hypothetical protein ABH922_002839 [Rhodococcus sp. 27YEA15]|uniref:hypothetical protein n=1 Tax=Rhodococcus sp. 27YEA15 TaxID=3156259 RepID=UPI003C7A8478